MNERKPATPGEDLLISARPIAIYAYGNDGPTAVAAVYRNPLGLPIFKHGGLVAAFKSGIDRRMDEVKAEAESPKERAIA